MGFLTWAAIGAGAIITHKVRKKIKKKREENECPECTFSDGISEQDFLEIIEAASKKIKRVKKLNSDAAIVYGVVESQSHLSEWYFKIDFNDFGHLTGRYWISSDNSDSDIPKYIAEYISSAIQIYLRKNDETTKTVTTQYCSNCGNKLSNDDVYCSKCGERIVRNSFTK